MCQKGSNDFLHILSDFKFFFYVRRRSVAALPWKRRYKNKARRYLSDQEDGPARCSLDFRRMFLMRFLPPPTKQKQQFSTCVSVRLLFSGRKFPTQTIRDNVVTEFILLHQVFSLPNRGDVLSEIVVVIDVKTVSTFPCQYCWASDFLAANIYRTACNISWHWNWSVTTKATTTWESSNFISFRSIARFSLRWNSRNTISTTGTSAYGFTKLHEYQNVCKHSTLSSSLVFEKSSMVSMSIWSDIKYANQNHNCHTTIYLLSFVPISLFSSPLAFAFSIFSSCFRCIKICDDRKENRFFVSNFFVRWNERREERKKMQIKKKRRANENISFRSTWMFDAKKTA